jgi:RNA polymerase sigma-70 factor, ECF subfamily
VIRKTPSLNANETAVTKNLRDWTSGDANSMDQVVATVLPDLHRMAAQILASERNGHTLQPTALINELYLRLRAGAPLEWTSRTHFLAVAAGTMRRILIDYARARCAQRRGGKEQQKVPFEYVEIGVPCSCDDLLLVEEALSRLQKVDERSARITELRFFAGLQESEIAAELGISEITVKRDWRFARAWLALCLDGTFEPDSR